MKSFTDRVKDGDTILVAEGYLLEINRRGFLTAGPYIPEIILQEPEMIKQIHREFAHAGSDIVVACLYYLNKSKLRDEGLEDKFEEMNKQGLALAKSVALETGTLAAGNLCNSIEFDDAKPETVAAVREMFKEQVIWAVEAGMDLFICETFREYAEAKLALDVCKEFAPGIPTVVMLAPYHDKTRDGLNFTDALVRLHEAGATVVGLNCAHGLTTIMPLAREIRQTYKGPMAICPVPYRTTKEHPTWATVLDPKTGKQAWPDDLETVACSIEEIETFGRECMELDIKYLGFCCGNSAKWTRALARTLDHSCPALRYQTITDRCTLNTVRDDMKARGEQV